MFAVLALAPVLVMAGCAPYLQDRTSDLLDSFTFTSEAGSIGASVQAGPAGLGLNTVQPVLVRHNSFGLSGGRLGLVKIEESTLVVWRAQHVYAEPLEERHKGFSTESIFPVPYLWQQVDYDARERNLAPRYTQIELAAGFIGGWRLGANPGEWLDFLLGWAGLDLYGDDVAVREAKGREREQTVPDPGKGPDEGERRTPDVNPRNS